jgi:hypothetical protein
VVASAVIGIAALAWPLGDDEPGGVLDRALAAIGEGPVLHVVYRGDWGPTLVELSTGEVKPVVAESELWYDPKRGVKSISRLGGDVQGTDVRPAGKVSRQQEEKFVALADHYRAALEAGKARTLGRGRVDGRKVLWIRVRSEWFPDFRDGRNHLYAEEVAVDPKSYEPVYARSTLDGRPPPGGGYAIVELERVSAEDVDFEVGESAPKRHPAYAGAESGRHIPQGELARLFGEPAVWLGSTYAGKPLAQTLELFFKDKEKEDDPWRTTRAATLFYGQLRPNRGGVRLREDRKPYILLTEAKKVAPMWLAASGGGEILEGWVRIDRAGAGFLRRGGLYVSINAKTTREVLEAATALRSFGDPAPAPSTLELGRIAREVDARKAHRIEVSGGELAAPRPIVRRRGSLMQTGSANGITVRVYAGGVLRFDMRAMDRSLRRIVPRVLSWHCLRMRGGVLEGGGYGAVPSGGVKSVVALGHLPRGRVVPIRPPFSACSSGRVSGATGCAGSGFTGSSRSR